MQSENKNIKGEVSETSSSLSDERILEIENSVLENESNSKNLNSSNLEVESNSGTNIRKLSGGRIFAMVVVGILSSAFICLAVYGLYYNLIRYPSQMVESYETSGIKCLYDWTLAINTLNNSEISSFTGSDSYLSKEITYANGVTYREEFVKKMVNTVSYKPNIVVALNKYGNPLLDKNDEVIYKESLVNDIGETVTLYYIDYSKVELDAIKIKSLMSEINLNVGDVDYLNKLVEVFCKYMTSLEDSEIPLVSIEHTPNLVHDGTRYYITEDEDILLDKALFSSDEFHNLLLRFSLVASGDGVTELQPREEWVKWNELSKEEKVGKAEPTKYDYKKIVNNTWCGSYYLTNEYSYTDGWGNVISGTNAEVGDGTIENPAGINTSILTYIFVNETDSNGNIVRVKKPIRVKLIEYRVSQGALDYFQSKDNRNRGFDIKSEVQYASYTFEITNLSNSTITIYDDSSLADGLANVSPRTGTIFGLQDSVILKPDETGIIESWGSSLELNKKYLIWGSNFNREEEPVWFRVLAGNVDDPSEDKGVSINNSRYDED